MLKQALIRRLIDSPQRHRGTEFFLPGHITLKIIFTLHSSLSTPCSFEFAIQTHRVLEFAIRKNQIRGNGHYKCPPRYCRIANSAERRFHDFTIYHLAKRISLFSIFLRQLWQGLPFLPQISRMRRNRKMGKMRKREIENCNRCNFAISKPRLSEQRAERISSYFERKRFRALAQKETKYKQIKKKKIMAKTKKMVKQVLMSIAALVSLTMTLVEEFSRVTSIGGGFVEN